MQVAEEQKLKPFAPFVVGQIVGYVGVQKRRVYELSQRKPFVVHVEPQREFKVARALEDDGFTGWCPHVVRKVRTIGERYRDCKKPLLVGYVIARFDPDNEPWQTIVGIKGVIRVFTVNERPLPLPDREWSALAEAEIREREGKARKIKPIEAKPGDFVRIKDGPFQGFFAFVTAVDQKHWRINADVDIFGRPTPVEFDADQLEVVLDNPTGIGGTKRPQYMRPRSPR